MYITHFCVCLLQAPDLAEKFEQVRWTGVSLFEHTYVCENVYTHIYGLALTLLYCLVSACDLAEKSEQVGWTGVSLFEHMDVCIYVYTHICGLILIRLCLFAIGARPCREVWTGRVNRSFPFWTYGCVYICIYTHIRVDSNTSMFVCYRRATLQRSSGRSG